MKSLVANNENEYNVATYINSWPWLLKPSLIQKKGILKTIQMSKDEAATFNGYRYGFNGLERDDEWNGTGNTYDFGVRIYDSRLGRWLARDPLEIEFLSISTYVYVTNRPIIMADPTGKSGEVKFDVIYKKIEMFSCVIVKLFNAFNAFKPPLN